MRLKTLKEAREAVEANRDMLLGRLAALGREARLERLVEVPRLVVSGRTLYTSGKRNEPRKS